MIVRYTTGTFDGTFNCCYTFILNLDCLYVIYQDELTRCVVLYSSDDDSVGGLNCVGW